MQATTRWFQLAVVCACILTPRSLSAAPQNLRLFIWSEYIDPAIVKAFERQFDCRVTTDLYEDEEAMLAKIQGGGDRLFDICVPPDHSVPAMIKLNLLASLRHERIPNLKNLDPRFASPPYDSGNKFTAAYQWGTVGLLIRRTNGEAVTPTWGLLFDPKQQRGPFLLMDAMRDQIGAALKFKGHSLNSTDSKELLAARDLILESKQRCLSFDASVAAKNKVLAGAARCAIVYSGEGVRAMKEDTNTVYLIPREGSQIWVDNLAVLARAPNRDLAEKFVNFILDAKIGAQLSGFTQFATPNKAAMEFIKQEDLRNPAIYPPEEVKAKLEFLQDLGAKTRLYDEIWTQVKAK